MYKDASELMSQCKEQNKRIWQIAVENEMKLTSSSYEDILSRFDDRLEIMFHSAQKALNAKQATKGGLIDGVAKTQYDYSKKENISGRYINYVMSLAYSCSEVNASMGKICASPTAGSCGIVPAVLLGLSQAKNISREKTLEGLITASAVGAIYTKNATVAGADGGCQAECGSAAAMAAAAITELAGGTPHMVSQAVAIALKNILGLVCDPVAGLVEIPCIKRNASGVAGAFVAAEMALAGIDSAIPADEVIWSMKRIGDVMSPTLKETAEGGLAATPTGRKLHDQVFGPGNVSGGCSGCSGCHS